MSEALIADKIEETVKDHDIVLFMKGTRNMPRCGFSGRIASILDYMQVSWHDVDVLQEDALREGVKRYSDWPTIPQLYVKGKFVGGCDIVTEMVLSGEFDDLLDKSSIQYDQTAAQHIRDSSKDNQ